MNERDRRAVDFERRAVNQMSARRHAVSRIIAIFGLIGALGSASGCGGADPPARAVIEEDVGEWEFRRYQKALDVEVWIPDNRGVAHAASYVDAAAVRRGDLGPGDVVSAVVSRYERAEGVRAAVGAFARDLARGATYEVETVEAAGALAVRFRGGGEAWLLWPASDRVIKVGGRRRASVPDDVVEAYAGVYSSSLSEDPLAESD